MPELSEEMTTSFRIGTVDVPARVERERYFKELSYLELSALFAGPQKPSSLAKWAEAAPAGALGLVAPALLTHRKLPAHARPWPSDPALGDFRAGPSAAATIELLAAAVKELRARAVIFRSPDDFSPSQSNRDRLAQFFAEVAPAEAIGAERVWLPGGLWEVRSAAMLATELGVTLAFDPLVVDPSAPEETFEDLEAAALYFRIESAGRAGLVRNEKLEELAALVEHYESSDLTVAFASAERWQDARNFKKLFEVA